MLRSTLMEYEGDNDPIVQEKLGALKELLEKIPRGKEDTVKMSRELDEQAAGGSLTAQAEKHVGFGPIQLNNIRPPHVVAQVWSMVGTAYGAPDLTLDEFLMHALTAVNQEDDNPPTLIQKVNAIYNWLNFVGYYRDEGLKKTKRFKASFSDMTHAGYAAVCTHFFCNDVALAKKAHAAYEYLGLPTKISQV